MGDFFVRVFKEFHIHHSNGRPWFSIMNVQTNVSSNIICMYLHIIVMYICDAIIIVWNHKTALCVCRIFSLKSRLHSSIAPVMHPLSGL